MSRTLTVFLIAVLLIIIGFSFYYLEKGSRALFFEAETAINELQIKRKAISEMIDSNRQMALILLRMHHEQDFFLRDEISLQVNHPSIRFSQAQKIFFNANLTQQQQKIFNLALSYVRGNLINQREAIQLMRIDSMEHASEILFEGLLPGQNQAIELFIQILTLIEEETSEVQKHLSAHQLRNKQSIMTLAIIFFLVGMVIMILLFRNNKTLENKVSKRTAQLTAIQNKEKLGRIRYQKIIETAVDAIITINKAGLMTSFNPAAKAMFGYDEGEVLGKNVALLMPDSFGQSHDGFLMNYFKTGVKKIIGIGREVVCVRKNQSLFPADLSISEIEVAGEITFTGILRDLTEQKHIEQQLQIAREKAELDQQEAERANKAKSDFLSSMSHELRTPLNAIIGFAQILEYSTLEGEDKKNVQQVLKASRYLLELIKDVLDLSGIESGRVELSLAAVDMRQIIQDCLVLIDESARSRNITVGHSIVSEELIWADRVRVKQVVLNLLSNAVKYNNEGGYVFIETRVVEEGWLQLRVTDSGTGIPVDKIDDLFIPFNRLGVEYANIEGSGIGLTITRRIIEQMGGKVGVESQVGIGSSFYVDLPLVTQEQIEQMEFKPQEAKKLMNETSPELKYTVLYIEDNSSNLDLMKEIMKLYGNVKLLTSHTAELGIEEAKTSLPDLILLDINLPGMDGFKAIKEIKKIEKIKNIPVIAVTANAMSHDVQQGGLSGFSEYVTKPLDIGPFLEVLGRYLP